MGEIQAIIRQITASVTFLPLLQVWRSLVASSLKGANAFVGGVLL